jgi:release factor glutamine methyltransferase
MNLQALLRDASATLASSSASGRLDAELLLAHASGLTRTQLRLDPDRELATDTLATFATLLSRRQAGEPLAYLVSERAFWSLNLKVTPAVLIPRPETELLVERALIHLSGSMHATVVDLGTGSGAVALSIAKDRPQTSVLGIDLSADALAIAEDNAQRHGIKNARFAIGDWLKGLSIGRVEMIVSNPPYIAAGDPHLEPEVARHEPPLALIAGNTGLEAIQAIAHQAPPFLAQGGWLLFEHGWLQGAAVRAALESAGFTSVASHADLAGHERVTEGRWTSGYLRDRQE